MDSVNLTNVSEVATNGTKVPATPEGMAVAYSSLFLMAIIPIFMGSFRSVKFQKRQHVEMEISGEMPEKMSMKDAAMFPFIASGALFGLYIIFRIFSKEYINLLLASYFLILGIYALTRLINPIIRKYVPACFPDETYHLMFTQGDTTKEELINLGFTRKDIIGVVICTLFGLWYIWKKHWVANNLIGFAFSLNGIELLQLNSVAVGCLLLGGLFVYDIFWVFGTDVMVTVAKSFEAPIKLVFPQDLLENGLNAKNFAMLGLGDIVVPGIFIAILLRYDYHRKVLAVAKQASDKVSSSNFDFNFPSDSLYFCVGFVAYCLGLGTTIFVMHYFKHAQPALLYLVPLCVGLPLLTAIIKGDLMDMFKYEDNPETEAEKKKD